jgi:hypothetical protein
MRCCIHIHKILLICIIFFLDSLSWNHFHDFQTRLFKSLRFTNYTYTVTSLLRFEFVYFIQHGRSCCIYYILTDVHYRHSWYIEDITLIFKQNHYAYPPLDTHIWLGYSSGHNLGEIILYLTSNSMHIKVARYSFQKFRCLTLGHVQTTHF